MSLLRKLIGKPDTPTAVDRENELRNAVQHMFALDRVTAVLLELSTVGTDLPHADRQRVQLATLKLSEGKDELLRTFAEVARQDFRDVLLWAETPKPTQDQARRNEAELETLLKQIDQSQDSAK
jgi:hypothetical protein